MKNDAKCAQCEDWWKNGGVGYCATCMQKIVDKNPELQELQKKGKAVLEGLTRGNTEYGQPANRRKNARGILPPPGSALDDKPMASAAFGQTGPERSYRYPSSFGGWIMIGAGSTQEALSEAKRSLSDGSSPTLDKLQKWDGSTYVRAK